MHASSSPSLPPSVWHRDFLEDVVVEKEEE